MHRKDTTITQLEAFDMIESATSDLLDAASELSRFPWTATSSEIIDTALSIAAKVEELRQIEQPAALPANVVVFRRGVAS